MYLKLRHIVFLMGAALLMASCTSHDPTEPGKGAEVTFATADLSRASATADINFNDSGFAIYGDMRFMNSDHLTTVFDGTIVTYRNGKWTYEDPQYWYPKHEHSFVAVYPAAAEGKSDIKYSDSRLSFTYTLPDDFKAATDLMMATHRRQYQYNGNSSSSSLPVMLYFQHILSRINFKVTNEGAADVVIVNKIVLEGINRTGTFAISPAPILSGSGQTDDSDLSNDSWSNISNTSNLTANISVDIPEDEVGELFPDDNALFMIPQPDNNDVIMHITYTLIDAGADDEQFTLTAEAPIGGWEPGKVYTYSMTISEITKEIYLTVSVKPWQTPQGTGIMVPES